MDQDTDFTLAFVPPVDPLIDAFLVDVGFGFNPGSLRRACRREAMKMNARSDAQLALFGITRDQIPAYVLREHFPAHAPVQRFAA